jgi:hypothetical protein
VTVFRLRPIVLFGSTLLLPVLAAAAVSALLEPVWVGPAIAFTAWLPGFLRARKRRLVVTRTGLSVVRDRYRMHVQWGHVIAVESRRRQGMLAEEWVLEHSDLEAHGTGRRATRTLDRARRVGADRRVQISFYDKSWREGVVGNALRYQGVITGA